MRLAQLAYWFHPKASAMVCVFFCLSVLAPLIQSAQTKTKQPPSNPPTVSTYIYKQLNLAQQQIDSNLPETAQQTLEKILQQPYATPYEKALAQQTYALIHYQQNQTDKAIGRFKQALDSNALPLQAAQQIRYNLAQLYLSEEQYGPSISILNQWFRLTENPTGEAYLLVASAYSANNQYKEAIVPAEMALKLSTQPLESHYRLLLGLYLETASHLLATTLLEKMILEFPNNKQYWIQLAALYSQANRDKDSLAITEIAYQRQLLTRSDEIVRLAQQLLGLQYPHKAALVLEREMAQGQVEKTAENWALIATAWFNSREYQKALIPLTRAAEQTTDGRLYYRLAQAHFELDHFEKTIRNLDLALQKGGLDNPGALHLLSGIAYYNLHKPELANQSFEKSAQFEPTHAQALRWIQYLKRY